MAFILSRSYSDHPWRALSFLYTRAFITKTCVMNNKFPWVKNFLVILLDRIRILGHYVKENFLFSPLTGSVSSSATKPSLVPSTSLPMEHLRVSCSSLIYSPSIGRSSLPNSRFAFAHMRAYTHIYTRANAPEVREERVHWHCRQSSRNISTEREREW